jgi:hypothetical protein
MSDSDSDYSDYEDNNSTVEKEKPKGIGSLGVGKLGSIGKVAKDQQEETLLGADVTVVFQLPNGDKKNHTVNMGRPVEWLKVLVEREHGIAFENQVCDIMIIITVVC